MHSYFGAIDHLLHSRQSLAGAVLTVGTGGALTTEMQSGQEHLYGD